MAGPSHVPVLLDRVVALLAPALDHEGAVLVDATLGLGGHTEAVLERCALARVVGIDRDTDALARAGERLAAHGTRFTGVHAVYDEIPEVLQELGLDAVDAVLFDLGVSSLQLDVVERGFAYREDAPLDMRMDGTGGPTAADVLNTYSAPDLARVLREYGEERFARQIANAVVRTRETTPFTTSARLVELLYDVIPAPARRTGGHPAKRTFQALGGRVVVESYHSLEDRLVKRAFVEATRSDVPEDLPFVPAGHEPAFRLLTRGAEKADPAEVDHNPRAASVRLRALERLTPSPNRGVA